MQIASHARRWSGLLIITLVGAALWASSETIRATYLKALGWTFTQVREFHQVLTDSVSALADETSLSTSFVLIASSFLYGVFHAAGPGHGKVILSTYLLSRPEKVKRSLGLATLSALMQGLVAIFLVYGLFYLFGLVSRDMKDAVAWSERLAFTLVVVIGLGLVWRGLKILLSIGKKHHHDHHHHGDDHHDHQHGDAVCSTCGHAHMPTNEQLEAATDWRTSIGVVLSIGLRPCTGAILVLVFARYSDVIWAGVAAVLAMSLGTALTVSILAITAVGARQLAVRLLSASDGMSERLGAYAAIIGGGVLVIFALGLLSGSFDAPQRSMGL